MTPLLGLGLGVVLVATGKALPLAAASSTRAWATFGLGALLWAPTIVFGVLGGASAWRLREAIGDPTKIGGGRLEGAVRDEWAKAAVLGSLGWWGAAVLVAIAIVLLAWRVRT